VGHTLKVVITMDDTLMMLLRQTKDKLRDDLTEMKKEIERLLLELDHNRCCILNDFGSIHRLFTKVQATASSYYLEGYLSPYTREYPVLSIATQNLSKKRHGALIVVERNDSVQPWIHSGVDLSAKLTGALIESIFYPGNPLHDGAVLIKNNDIVSARNVLPLSNRTRVGDERLGTRHRAALGLTERTDALALIVSEETGRISFSVQGMIYPITPEMAPLSYRTLNA